MIKVEQQVVLTTDSEPDLDSASNFGILLIFDKFAAIVLVSGSSTGSVDGYRGMPESIDFIVAPDDDDKGGGRGGAGGGGGGGKKSSSPPKLNSEMKDSSIWRKEIDDALDEAPR